MNSSMFCPSCHEVFSFGEKMPIGHGLCYLRLCTSCWIMQIEKKKHCPECQKEIRVEDLFLMVFGLNKTELTLQRFEDNDSFHATQCRLLEYWTTRLRSFHFFCNNHDKKVILFDLLFGTYHCIACKFNSYDSRTIETYALFKRLTQKMQDNISQARDVVRSIENYYKDQVVNINSYIIEYYYNLVFKYIFGVMGIPMDVNTSERVKEELKTYFVYFNTINKEVCADLEKFKNKLEGYIIVNMDALNEIRMLITQSNEVLRKNPIFELIGSRIPSSQKIIEEFYENNSKVIIMGKDLCKIMRNTIFGVLVRNIDDDRICQNIIACFRDCLITGKRVRYGWVYQRCKLF